MVNIRQEYRINSSEQGKLKDNTFVGEYIPKRLGYGFGNFIAEEFPELITVNDNKDNTTFKLEAILLKADDFYDAINKLELMTGKDPRIEDVLNILLTSLSKNETDD